MNIGNKGNVKVPTSDEIRMAASDFSEFDMADNTIKTPGNHSGGPTPSPVQKANGSAHLKKCIKCGNIQSESNDVCLECGEYFSSGQGTGADAEANLGVSSGKGTFTSSPVVKDTSQRLFCGKCGAPLKSQAAFCGKCSAPVTKR